jgi:hypothetical protein
MPEKPGMKYLNKQCIIYMQRYINMFLKLWSYEWETDRWNFFYDVKLV